MYLFVFAVSSMPLMALAKNASDNSGNITPMVNVFFLLKKNCLLIGFVIKLGGQLLYTRFGAQSDAFMVVQCPGNG